MSLGLRYASAAAQTTPLGVSRDVRVGAPQTTTADSSLPAWWEMLSIAGGAVGAYHGWKRDESIGWAIGWGVLGVLFPVIVIPVALAQGIGKKA
jgi:hypothetical protein